MKKLLLAAALAVIGAFGADAQVIFQQNFTSSTTLSTYISATTPNSGQWNAISTSGAGVTISTAANNLSFTRGASNSGTFSRTTDFSPTPTALTYAFTLTVSGNSAAATTAAVFQIGSGFGTANSTESNANTYARLGINFTATAGQFSIRDVTNGTTSANFSGTQNVFWVLNNSGSTVNYTDPTAAANSLTNDTADLWIGNTQVLNGVAIETASQVMTDLKFAFTGGTATIVLDNFTITQIPEPSTYALIGLGLAGLVVLRRMKKSAKI